MRFFRRLYSVFAAYPRSLGMLVVTILSGIIVWVNIPSHLDPAWAPHPTDIVALPDPLYKNGPLSGAWIGDLQYFEGKWFAGDGRGGIWYSRQGIDWTRAEMTARGRSRSMQNAPVRSINRGANGTYVATFLAGGRLRLPTIQKALGMQSRQRAPVARSTDGVHWEVREVPNSCGIHFSATDGQGTWIAQGCKDNLLLSRDDAYTWREVPTGLPPRLHAPGYIDGVWVVAAGQGGQASGIYYSRDLLTWTKALAFPPGVVPKRTLSLNGRLIMTGSSRFVASSQSGIDWQIRSLVKGGGRTMRAGVWHPEIGYILAGIKGIVMYSKDLKHWRCSRIGMGTRVTGMAVSPAGEVFASTIPLILFRLEPSRMGTEEAGAQCL